MLLGLNAFGLHSIFANYISTTLAFCFSFVANRHFAFKATEQHVGKQIALFVTVTLFGIWVLQPPIIFGVEELVDQKLHVPSWTVLLLGKLAATGVTLVWNYYMYSRVVFKRRRADNRPAAE